MEGSIEPWTSAAYLHEVRGQLEVPLSDGGVSRTSSNGDHALCWRVGVVTYCEVLQDGSQYNGHCDGNHRDTKGLGKTSRQTAACIHVLGPFPAIVLHPLYRRQGQSSTSLVPPEDGPVSCRPASFLTT